MAGVELDRAAWASLRGDEQLGLDDAEIAAVGAVDERVDRAEVVEVYLPLARLLHDRIASSPARPFVVGIGGSVAVGKTTAALLLEALLSRWHTVALVTTDGFLLPNAELAARGLSARKGFPESYDGDRFAAFFAALRAGDEVRVPRYSHEHYDVVPGDERVVAGAEVVIVEGVNALQGTDLDAAVYLDAEEDDIVRWYVERFTTVQAPSMAERMRLLFGDAGTGELEAMARQVWEAVNHPNLVDHILPSRQRADVVLRKGPDHRVETVVLRR